MFQKEALVCLIGNPGRKQRETRHNAAWLLMDNIALVSGGWKKKFNGEYVKSGNTVFLKPHTYVNRSGESVQSALSFFRIEPENLLVIHDDMEIAFGEYSWKRGGGTSGHKGLKSISQSIGTKDFDRLRTGIGRPVHGNPSEWVLTSFSSLEKEQFRTISQSIETELTAYLAGNGADWSKIKKVFN